MSKNRTNNGGNNTNKLRFFAKLQFLRFSEPEAKKPKLNLANVDNLRKTRRQTAMNQGFDSSLPTPFSNLPNEMLEHIFTFLDHKSLLNSFLVDKLWCSVISSSHKLMAKLPLIIRLTRGGENMKIKKFTRYYQSIKLHDVQKKLPKYLSESLKNVGRDLKTLTFHNCMNDDLANVLKDCPQLEKYILINNMAGNKVSIEFDRRRFIKMNSSEISEVINFKFSKAIVIIFTCLSRTPRDSCS
jgi:hypothetical protein